MASSFQDYHLASMGFFGIIGSSMAFVVVVFLGSSCFGALLTSKLTYSTRKRYFMFAHVAVLVFLSTLTLAQQIYNVAVVALGLFDVPKLAFGNHFGSPFLPLTIWGVDGFMILDASFEISYPFDPSFEPPPRALSIVSAPGRREGSPTTRLDPPFRQVIAVAGAVTVKPNPSVLGGRHRSPLRYRTQPPPPPQPCPHPICPPCHERQTLVQPPKLVRAVPSSPMREFTPLRRLFFTLAGVCRAEGQKGGAMKRRRAVDAACGTVGAVGGQIDPQAAPALGDVEDMPIVRLSDAFLVSAFPPGTAAPDLPPCTARVLLPRASEPSSRPARPQPGRYAPKHSKHAQVVRQPLASGYELV
ncbi:hypothetical protein GALMADRAFT_159041 [Galerina marginata CBS 339.88]|uniref:Uncharacterized protein n=1 Tax=Galerina marginata (strain CBS 339.88) TaxID=685588 RepID=A0A067T008_GALM3|nr:hypothetical protein GALMADRAFT_159041 [Galerina marginata CBS 339.88]